MAERCQHAIVVVIVNLVLMVVAFHHFEASFCKGVMFRHSPFTTAFDAVGEKTVQSVGSDDSGLKFLLTEHQ